MSDVNIGSKLAGIDQFSVKWAGRDEHGNLQLQSNVFAVTVTPAPMFGANVRDFGFDQAIAMAEEAPLVEHNFGACYVREKSLRKEADGRWYVELSVDPHSVRFCQVTTELVNDNGESILDEDGNRQIKTGPRKESWILVELGQLEPLMSHPLHGLYRQTDRRTTAMVNATARSAKIGAEKSSGGRGKGKGKRARLSPAQIAQVLAQADA